MIARCCGDVEGARVDSRHKIEIVDGLEPSASYMKYCDAESREKRFQIARKSESSLQRDSSAFGSDVCCGGSCWKEYHPPSLSWGVLMGSDDPGSGERCC